MKPRLICMQLAKMLRVHPQQITRNCAKCGTEVGIYPSGQRVLAQHKDIEIICDVCNVGGLGELAPGAEFEPFESKWRN